MTEDFRRYISSLPQRLSDEELEVLFYEMKNLKEEFEKTRNASVQKKFYDVRETIITHNLRMCYAFAKNYCKKRNIMDYIETIYSTCVYNFIQALDTFDITKGNKITTYFYRSMRLELAEEYENNLDDALSYRNLKIEDIDENGETPDLFDHIADEDNSNIPEDSASKEFINDIFNYIDRIKDNENRQMVMMYLGYRYDKKYTQKEIATIFGKGEYTVCRRIFQELNKLKDYIILQNPLSFPDEYKKLKSRPVFESKEEMNKYIVDSYFAEDEKLKTARELVEELGCTETYIYNLVKKYYKLREEQGLSKKPVGQHTKHLSEKQTKTLFEERFGLNGRKILNSNELMQKYRINNTTTLYKTIKTYAKKVCSDEQFAQLQKDLKAYQKQQALNIYAYIYYSYKGINGYTKKTALTLKLELNKSKRSIYDAIKAYQNYLDGLPFENDDFEQKDKETSEMQ